MGSMTPDLEFTTVSPYLFYPDGDAAAAWLIRVLGFGPARSVRGPDGGWAEGEVAIGAGARVDISGGTGGPGGPAAAPRGQGALLIVGVTDADAQYRRIRAAGIDLEPPRDEPYGPRTCHVTDPWGYRWYFWQGQATFPAGNGAAAGGQARGTGSG
jgi:uncharacterized glyoxalase superfamily protein PhnB